MGNRTPAGVQHTETFRQYFQTDLPKFIVQKRIGNGKFMKSYVVKVDGVPLLVKVYMRFQDEDLQVVAKELSVLWKTISPTQTTNQNLLPYQMWIKSNTKIPRSNLSPVYLIRQYIHANLHDRLSTRPFLSEVEKLWLMYQLFKALEACHLTHHIIHGDIKPENVLCTSWNWLMLTDFGTFKPAILPDDDPTDFQFYFDSMGRSNCYIAPERFFKRDVKTNINSTDHNDGVEHSSSAQLTAAIDVFSLGCTMAEVFLDGDTFIDLPGMLKYVGGVPSTNPGNNNVNNKGVVIMERLDHDESSSKGLLGRIKNKLVRDVIIDMTQRNPEQRTTVRNYRHILEGRRPASSMVSQGGTNPREKGETDISPGNANPFPEYFSQTILPLFNRLQTKGYTPDDCIVILCENYNKVMTDITGQGDASGQSFFEFAAKSVVGARASKDLDIKVAATPSSPNNGGNGEELMNKFAFKSDVLNSARSRPNNGINNRVFSTRVMTNTETALNNSNNNNKNDIGRPTELGSGMGSGSGPTGGYTNNNLSLSVEDLLEKCSELMANIEANKPEISLEPSVAIKKEFLTPVNSTMKTRQAVPIRTVGKSSTAGRLSLSTKQNPSLLSGPALVKVALQSSYGIDTLLYSLRNNSLPSTSSFFDSGPSQAASSISSLKEETARVTYDGLLLPVQVICANFRSLKYPHTKIISIMLLVRFGSQCADHLILHRIIPILLDAVDDPIAQVRAAAVRALRSLLSVVRKVDAIESNIFPQYIFPALSNKVAKDSEPLVRVAFAESIGRFAEVSKRFLDQAHLAAQNRTINGEDSSDVLGTSPSAGNLLNPLNQSVRPGGAQKDNTFVAFPYDLRLKGLRDQVNKWIKDLLMEGSGGRGLDATRVGRIFPGAKGKTNANGTARKRPSQIGPLPADNSTSIIKRVLLVDVVRLCAFFGHDAMETLLQHLLTFLNDQDWEVRYAFCAKIPSVCAFVGPTITISNILPCIETALLDVEERVIARAIQSLTAIIQLGLISAKYVLVDFVKTMIPYSLHPCLSIRNSAIALFAAALNTFGPSDSLVLLLPLLKPIQQYDLSGCDLSLESLTMALQSGISRATFRWALKERLKSAPGNIPFEGLIPVDQSPPASSPGNNRVVSMSGGSATPKKPAAKKAMPPTISEGSAFTGEVSASPSSPQPGSSPSVSSKSLAVAYNSGQYMDVVEANKLKLLDKFIIMITNKMNMVRIQENNSNLNQARGRSAMSVSINTNAISGDNEPDSSNVLETSLDIAAATMADCPVESLFIPHQRSREKFFTHFQTEQLRRQFIANPANTKNANKVRAYYGIQTAESAKKALSTGIDEFNEFDANSENVVPPPTAASNKIQSMQSPLIARKTSNYLGLQGRGKETSVNEMIDSDGVDLRILLKRIKALNLAPIPPDLGTVVYAEDRPQKEGGGVVEASDPSVRSGWRPKENTLVAQLQEHTHSVNQLAVSPAQNFFASASSDQTVKIWKIRGIDRTAVPRSALTYKRHQGAVTSAVVLENSHSVASGSEDGSVHVWRVDHLENQSNLHQSGGPAGHASTIFSEDKYSSASTSEVKLLQPSEGAVVAVNHFNGDVASVVSFITQHGGLHGWDLRCARDAMHFEIRPELGQPSSLAIAPDRSWMCVGTSRGYVGLWDIRYGVMSRLWRHSSNGPIHRLATCKALPKVSPQMQQNAFLQKSEHLIGGAEGAYLFCAAGVSEAAVWAIPEGGECLKCFRAVPIKNSRGVGALSALPVLSEVPLPRHPHAPIISASDSLLADSQAFLSSPQSPLHQSGLHSFRTVLGRISDKGASYLVTAGTDKIIRYWDFANVNKCFAVAGLAPSQPKPTFDTPAAEGLAGKLFLSYDVSVPSAETVAQAHLPSRESRGPLPASPNCRDAITDLKSIDTPTRLMLSASRDGDIKLWR